MKIELRETESGFEFFCLPETIEDSATLLRLANSTKREVPQIRTSYFDKVYSSVWIKKKDSSAVYNCVENKPRRMS
jgi:hypothetical protein